MTQKVRTHESTKISMGKAVDIIKEYRGKKTNQEICEVLTKAGLRIGSGRAPSPPDISRIALNYRMARLIAPYKKAKSRRKFSKPKGTITSMHPKISSDENIFREVTNSNLSWNTKKFLIKLFV